MSFQIAILGQREVGKTSVIESLCNINFEHRDNTELVNPRTAIIDNIEYVFTEVSPQIAVSKNWKLKEAEHFNLLILVLNGEPYSTEVEWFNLVHENSLNVPKIVFVNKWDVIEATTTQKDQVVIRERIQRKMIKIVKSSKGIIYGSARRFNVETDEMTHQFLPQLMEAINSNLNIQRPALSKELFTKNGILKPEMIFISYKRLDWEKYVKPLIERLQNEGLSIWVDQHLLEGGDDWMYEINRALGICQRLILCVSQEALKSRHVRMEYLYFFNNGKKIYPLICGEAELPAELQIIQNYSYKQLDILIKMLKIMH